MKKNNFFFLREYQEYKKQEKVNEYYLNMRYRKKIYRSICC